MKDKKNCIWKGEQVKVYDNEDKETTTKALKQQWGVDICRRDDTKAKGVRNREAPDAKLPHRFSTKNWN